MKAEGIGQKKFNIQFLSLELNGENRLIMASNGNTVVQYAYDYMGKTVYDISDLSSPTSDFRYVYDGWNLIAETMYGQSPVVAPSTNYYTWGLDLSGTLQGAGGIGGLLSCSSRSASGMETYYPVADGNGNITEYVTTNGTIAAHYEYNSFGGTIASSGTKKDAFKFRFSTKYLDDETGLYNYGMRDLDVELGRWISRDPIEERAFNSFLRRFIKSNEKVFQSRQLKYHRLAIAMESINSGFSASVNAWEQPSSTPIIIRSLFSFHTLQQVKQKTQDDIFNSQLLQSSYVFCLNQPTGVSDTLGLMADDGFGDFYKWWLGKQTLLGAGIGAITILEQLYYCKSLPRGYSIDVQTASTRMATIVAMPILGPMGYIFELRITKNGPGCLDCDYKWIVTPIGGNTGGTDA